MNTDTGVIYETPKEIEEAKERGEPIIPVSKKVAQLMKWGLKTQKEKNKAKALRRKFRGKK